MKNILKAIFFLSSFFAFSQEGVIVPLNTPEIDFQSGTYAKDINNELNPFVGSWVFIDNNIKYTLVFQKMEHLLETNSPTFYHYEDELVCKYEVKNLTSGSILYSTMNATSYDDFDITSIGGIYNGEIEFAFFDRPRCNRLMKIRLYKMTFQPGTTIPYQVRYYNLGSDGYDSEGCLYANIHDIPVSLPLGSFTLTKE